MSERIEYYDVGSGRAGAFVEKKRRKLSSFENDMGFSARLSELTNDAEFITAAQAAAAAPVQSVNGETGNPWGLIYKGTAYSESITDFDNVTAPGIYYLNRPVSEVSNGPSGNFQWSYLYVTARGSDYKVQEIVKPVTGRWVREYSGDPAVWSAWRQDVKSVNGATGNVTRAQLGCLSADGDVPAVWIGSSYDLNDFYSGVVLCYSNVQNVPSADWWHVMASGTTGTCVQIAAKLYNNSVMMTRRCASGTWSAWEPVTGWLPTSGGTMSGSIKFPNATAMPHKSSPQFLLTIDSFANGGEMGYVNLSEAPFLSSTVQTGSWTPSIPRSGGVAITNANYQKSGHTVHLSAAITITAGASTYNPYLAEECLPFLPSIKGNIFGVFRLNDNISYNMAASPGVNNNVWFSDVTANNLRGYGFMHLMYITNS